MQRYLLCRPVVSADADASQTPVEELATAIPANLPADPNAADASAERSRCLGVFYVETVRTGTP